MLSLSANKLNFVIRIIDVYYLKFFFIHFDFNFPIQMLYAKLKSHKITTYDPPGFVEKTNGIPFEHAANLSLVIQMLS